MHFTLVIIFYYTPKGLKNCHFRCHNFLFQNVLNIRQHDLICIFRFFLLHLYFHTRQYDLSMTIIVSLLSIIILFPAFGL